MPVSISRPNRHGWSRRHFQRVSANSTHCCVGLCEPPATSRAPRKPRMRGRRPRRLRPGKASRRLQSGWCCLRLCWRPCCSCLLVSTSCCRPGGSCCWPRRCSFISVRVFIAPAGTPRWRGPATWTCWSPSVPARPSGCHFGYGGAACRTCTSRHPPWSSRWFCSANGWKRAPSGRRLRPFVGCSGCSRKWRIYSGNPACATGSAPRATCRSGRS